MNKFWGRPKPRIVNITGQVNADKSNEVNPPQFGPHTDKESLRKAIDFASGSDNTLELGKVYLDLEKEKFIIHRSAILAYKACPYKYYLEYAYGGHGLSHHQIPQHLVIGICIHRGLQHLLEHCRIEHPNGDFTEKCIDDSVVWANKVFVEILQKRTLELKKSWDKTTKSWIHEDLTFTVREISSLLEALIRAYAVFRLPAFLEEYEVLEVEQEEVFDEFSEIVLWLGKADGLVRRRRDNALMAVSYKTAADFNNSTMSNILIDMQGCSEISAIENRLNRIYKAFYEATSLDDKGVIYYKPEFVNKGMTKIAGGDLMRSTDGVLDYFAGARMNNVKKIKVFANQYEYLVKGKHRADSSEPTHFKYQTHLLHAIKTNATASMQLGSGLKFGIQSSKSAYEWVIPPGKLPAGKRKVSIVDDIGIKEWISMLAKGEVQPEKGNPFEDLIYGGEERLAARTEEQLKEWRISTQFEAEEIASYIKVLEDIQETIDYYSQEEFRDLASIKYFLASNIELFQERLLQFFSRDGKDAQLCYDYYGGSCPFTGHCHEGISIEDAITSGLYIIREPHHEVERQRFIEKGWTKEDA